ncbi:NAD(P)-dependent oxidoreductase [Pokkaliibacter sp. CJK22405]|uniref:NAD(P)-dependent oxidoreductase n=1 Tax=Pokkaliibacter sp. CJK22405 TaxID=3384615 RepID=UPI003984B8FA
MKVAFVGLGVMGYPMAGHLLKAGHDVTVYNRTTSKAEAWVAEYGGQHALTPMEAAQGAEMVFCCVGNDNDLREVTLGEQGIYKGLGEGCYLVDHTTASAEVARELDAQAKAQGAYFLDAPVSGGQAGAENGVLTVMMGGDQADFDTVLPVIQCYSRQARLLGPAGSGQLAKMVNQICIAGIVQGLSEGLHFAEAVGLDGKAVVDVISKGAAQSWQMENRSATMLDGKFDYGFAVDWMRKDLFIALTEARNHDIHLPLTALVDQFYSDVQSMGGGRWDTSSLITRLNRNKAK